MQRHRATSSTNARQTQRIDSKRNPSYGSYGMRINSRVCPKCSAVLHYSTHQAFYKARKLNRVCYRCSLTDERSKKISEAIRLHGFTWAAGRHPLYTCWSSIKQRCYNPKANGFKYWGGRGITMCREWLRSPEKFIRWALAHGWKQGLLIDRRNNNGDYTPKNCRFLTRADSNRNKRNCCAV